MATIKRALHAAAIILLVLTNGAGASAGDDAHYEVGPGERALLIELSSYLDGPLRAGNLAELAEYLGGPDEAAAALAASLIFKSGPREHWDLIVESFAVRDYDLRDRGVYNRVLEEDLPAVLEALENRQPEFADSRLTLLVFFLHFRDSNEWIINGDRRVSLARVFRAAFLAQLLDGAEIDPVETASAIDRHTQAAMGH